MSEEKIEAFIESEKSYGRKKPGMKLTLQRYERFKSAPAPAPKPTKEEKKADKEEKKAEKKADKK